ncbi:MAG: DUF2461 domain-containing protein [Cyclobacteriaceae bacterium]
MSTVSKQAFEFLQDIKQNNNKPWFQKNKSRYETIKTGMEAFAEDVLQQMNEVDVIETPSGKKSLFRIYRDVRFSKDKTPYKTHFSGYLRRAGADRRGGYFFHIAPGDSYIAGGFFAPDAKDLLHIRKQIQADPELLRKELAKKPFKQHFGRLLGSQLKTAPKGFDKEDANIDLLRYKQYYVEHSFTDKEVLSKDFAQQVAKGFAAMIPFFDCMTEYLTTDLNGESLL